MSKLITIGILAIASLFANGCGDIDYLPEQAFTIEEHGSETQLIHYSYGGWYPDPSKSANFKAYLDLEVQADQTVTATLKIPGCVIESNISYESFKELDSRIQYEPKTRQPENVLSIDAGDELITRKNQYGDIETTYLKLGDSSAGKLTFTDGGPVRSLVDKVIEELAVDCD